jgi:hypothetical protein
MRLPVALLIHATIETLMDTREHFAPTFIKHLLKSQDHHVVSCVSTNCIQLCTLNSIHAFMPSACLHSSSDSLRLSTSSSRGSNGTGPVERVLCERPCQSLLCTDLLRANERVDGYGNSAIDVKCRAIFRQTHLAERFSNSHDGLKMTNLLHVSEMLTMT